jgi:stage IV sporulation protein B
MSEARKRYRRFLYCCLTVSIFFMGVLFYFNVKEELPDEIHIFANQETDWDSIFKEPTISYDSSVEASGNGSYRVGCRLFGIIPLKTVKVTTIEPQTVYASGTPIGIYMETKGVLVIESGEIRDSDGILCSPAKHIIHPGDYIQSVNGETLSSKKQLMQMVKENHGEPMRLEVLRYNEVITLALTPTRTDDGDYKLGIWVRDNIQGIGTMTYTNDDNNFAALGHGISDVDTGERLEISEGILYRAQILSVQKGAAGSPGELKGIIDYDESMKEGEITSNTENGIKGHLAAGKEENINREECVIGLKQEIKVGAAQIMCDVGEGVQKYDIEVTQINWNARDTNKSFEIHVIDSRLLELTGGIVQGMSGSPILQDQKLIGAVTHVFVNDPTKGYGIFAETML